MDGTEKRVDLNIILFSRPRPRELAGSYKQDPCIFFLVRFRTRLGRVVCKRPYLLVWLCHHYCSLSTRVYICRDHLFLWCLLSSSPASLSKPGEQTVCVDGMMGMPLVGIPKEETGQTNLTTGTERKICSARVCWIPIWDLPSGHFEWDFHSEGKRVIQDVSNDVLMC